MPVCVDTNLAYSYRTFPTLYPSGTHYFQANQQALNSADPSLEYAGTDLVHRGSGEMLLNWYHRMDSDILEGAQMGVSTAHRV